MLKGAKSNSGSGFNHSGGGVGNNNFIRNIRVDVDEIKQEDVIKCLKSSRFKKIQGIKG